MYTPSPLVSEKQYITNYKMDSESDTTVKQ